MNFDDKIKKLNVLKKLLNQDLVSVKLGLGEEEVVREVNEEIKSFLLSSMEATFAGTPANAQFTPQEVAVMKEFLRKLMAKAAGPTAVFTPTGTEPMDGRINTVGTPPYSPPPKPPTHPKTSPVLDALRAAGFDPNSSVAEKKAFIKNLKKS